MAILTKCKICSEPSTLLFARKILSKYDVSYFQCPKCEFIQTEEPFWLDEAYQSAITSLDLGIVSRNINLSSVTQSIIIKFFKSNRRFIDYGGGYGLLVRMMRDNGFDFYRQDKFCDNLFAKKFDVKDIVQKEKFELLTAFELFEHLPDPINEIKEMLNFSDNILFSTELQPDKENIPSWWYVSPEIGQHISLYSLRTLQQIGLQLGLNVYSNNINIHLFTKSKINNSIFRTLTKSKVAKIYNLMFRSNSSLLQRDFDMVKSMINNFKSI